jgi:RimJ/RimL family protein N-acetyltransferase
MAEGPDTRARQSASPRPMVRGRDVYLRPAERADLAAFVAWLSDADTTANLTTRAPLSLPLEERWFDGMLERQGRDGYHFVICLIADGRAIGSTSLFELDLLNGQAGFGIFIGDEAMRGRGYGTDALDAIVDFGFGELRLERIWLDVFTDNTRGIRSYEKAGFVREGTLRRAFYRRGAYRDAYRMSLLRSEWEALSRPKSWDRGTA